MESQGISRCHRGVLSSRALPKNRQGTGRQVGLTDCQVPRQVGRQGGCKSEKVVLLNKGTPSGCDSSSVGNSIGGVYKFVERGKSPLVVESAPYFVRVECLGGYRVGSVGSVLLRSGCGAGVWRWVFWWKIFQKDTSGGFEILVEGFLPQYEFEGCRQAKLLPWTFQALDQVVAGNERSAAQGQELLSRSPALLDTVHSAQATRVVGYSDDEYRDLPRICHLVGSVLASGSR